jgi:tryptophanyl-tRNA synthetase
MELAHSFKDKSNRLDDVNGGLFSYPMLMAADILLYDANIVPVGKDQLQHIEMTRNVASRFHSKMGETFILPDAKVQEDTKLIPGTDGEKMSKSKNNVIDIFLDDKSLRKQIMSIKTDSTPLESPKKWSTCNCFAIYELLADPKQIDSMKNKYCSGNYGYGHAKQELYELITEKFSNEREKYWYYMSNPDEINKILTLGAEKAALVAKEVLSRVRSKLGY